MRRLGLLALLSIVVLPAHQTFAQDGDVKPPVAKVIPKVDTLHGAVLTDNYFWIRDKKNPEVIAYLNQENAYTAARMKHTEALQKKLYDEMLARVKENDLSVPYRENGYYYYNRTEKG